MHLNKPANLPLLANLTKRPFLSTRHYRSQGITVIISPWLFKHAHFEIPLVLDIFSTLPVKYKTSEISPKCCHKIVNTMF